MQTETAQPSKKLRVLVTGFHKDLKGNDYSWIAANNLLPMKWPENVWVEVRDLNYSYQSLLIHLNYDQSNQNVSLEKCSFNRCYRLKDTFDYLPPGNCAVEGGVGRLETKLDLEPLRKKGEEYCKTRNLGSRLKCVVSKYPGESVPAYLYYLTLNYDPSKTLLVNIPSKTVFTSREINYALKGIILEALNQLYNLKDLKD